MKHRLFRVVPAVFALGLMGLAFAQIGCTTRTPVFTTEERFARISRNMGLEAQMINDDIDSLLLLRPVSGLTPWNVP